MTVRLTQGMVRRVHEDHPPGSQLYDEEVSGLRLVVGSKSSSYKFMGRINDGTARYMTITLGRADELALKTARAMAVDIKQKLARGEDPRKPKSTVPTLAEVLERYLAARANDLQPRTIHGYRDNLKPIMKDVGKLPMDKIDREMARSLHEKVTKKHGIYAANHAMRVLKLLYNDCARTFDLPPNPVSRAVRLHKEKVRDWAIAPADLPEFWRRLDGMQDRVRAACWLLMLTSGLRSSNARSVKWEHLCEEGTLLIPRAKSGRSFTLPLPRMMLQELERVKQETAPLCSPFVFPSITSGTGHIEKMGRTPRFPYAPHMMRHTYRTIALEVGKVSDVDVFEADGETLRHCAEAKDKPFTRADIDHAAGKVAEAGHAAMVFVFGPNASTEEDLPGIVGEYESKGFDLTFVDAIAFAEGIVSLAPSVTWQEVTEAINKHLGTMRAKEVTVRHCREVVDATVNGGP